jgi:hypothetical protein
VNRLNCVDDSRINTSAMTLRRSGIRGPAAY